ncbi:hypothetical protein MBT84_47765 [Streptomyces sp. MBT84]|uniref:Uncharacterized protein n=1 Tax=Streptomyces lannensis TaxID=766498 RepID=A0ABP7LUU7_9ACTN|nr:hypothetical protein [Streptomyces sp. MBT84]
MRLGSSSAVSRDGLQRSFESGFIDAEKREHPLLLGSVTISPNVPLGISHLTLAATAREECAGGPAGLAISR